VQALLPPGVNSAFDYRMEAVPAVGEHSEAILAELGWSAERIRALYAEEATVKAVRTVCAGVIP
jgi:crotonobetainyl-CoA:carnitine CoA-transferase CaiB-like acyl-CoA transferase